MTDPKTIDVAFIGCAGVPNRYGGFEAFVEFCGPSIAAGVRSVRVTCDARLYPDRAAEYNGLHREFIAVPANGALSIVHDLVAFARVFPRASHIVALGVSGAIWFPLFRLFCAFGGKRLLVNIDGVEWRRGKFGRLKRWLLRLFDWMAQRFAHVVIYDNAALRPFVLPFARPKAVEIAYSGDHVRRSPTVPRIAGTALTICRIEPENSIELLVAGALASSLEYYTIIGNWHASPYGRSLAEQWRRNPRLHILDPIYDQEVLSRYRESCDVYLHGHSVGGTNPSLVEMLFYDCRLVCLDVPYNRATAGDSASYFSDATSLAHAVTDRPSANGARSLMRSSYTAARISKQYIDALSRS